MLNKYYVLVDTEKKIVIDKIQKLPENWKNISGLLSLSDEQLKDLKWSGNNNLGWISINSQEIKKYSSSKENLELNKNTFKYLITDIRKNKQSEYIQYQGAKIKPDIKTLYSLSLLKLKKDVNFKCLNGYYTFTSFQVSELYDIVDSNIQKWFDWEMNVYSQIDSCNSISDFFNVNYESSNK
jgi:hypothetical protein